MVRITGSKGVPSSFPPSGGKKPISKELRASVQDVSKVAKATTLARFSPTDAEITKGEPTKATKKEAKVANSHIRKSRLY